MRFEPSVIVASKTLQELLCVVMLCRVRLIADLPPVPVIVVPRFARDVDLSRKRTRHRVLYVDSLVDAVLGERSSTGSALSDQLRSRYEVCEFSSEDVCKLRNRARTLARSALRDRVCEPTGALWAVVEAYAQLHNVEFDSTLKGLADESLTIYDDYRRGPVSREIFARVRDPHFPDDEWQPLLDVLALGKMPKKRKVEARAM